MRSIYAYNGGYYIKQNLTRLLTLNRYTANLFLNICCCITVGRHIFMLFFNCCSNKWREGSLQHAYICPEARAHTRYAYQGSVFGAHGRHQQEWQPHGTHVPILHHLRII